MLSYEDCVAMSELTEDEVAAIAEHEKCPEMLALELGSYLIQTPDGPPRLKHMLAEDIESATRSGHLAHAAKLKLVLQQFCKRHPDAA
jgi:hypothetical protein